MSTARALLAEPSLGPVQTLEVYDPLVAKIEAVLEHRRMLVHVRTLGLHHIPDQLAKLPTEIRDRLGTHGKVDARLVRLGQLGVEPAVASTPAGAYRLSWLLAAHRPGPPGAGRDPPAGTRTGPSARRTRHDAA